MEVEVTDGDGLSLPSKPEEPLQSDCCGLGCQPCVFDLYEEEISLWEKECQRIRDGKPNGSESDEEDFQLTPVLCKSEYRRFKIVDIKPESPDSYIFKFHLSSNQSLGLQVGEHIILRATVDKKTIIRQYTPVSDISTQGCFELLIKIYPEGRMSQFITSKQVGDSLEFRGPYGTFSYIANKWDKLYLLAGGTGIAPMAQLIQQLISNENDDTLVHLVYSCRSYKDLLLKSRLDEWSAFWNVTVFYVLSQGTLERIGSSGRYGDNIQYGRISQDSLLQILHVRPSNFFVLICGTTSFDKDMVSYLENLGVPSGNYFKY